MNAVHILAAGEGSPAGAAVGVFFTLLILAAGAMAFRHACSASASPLGRLASVLAGAGMLVVAWFSAWMSVAAGTGAM